MSAEQTILSDFLAYLQQAPQVIAVVVYDSAGKSVSYESLDEKSGTVSAELYRVTRSFIEKDASALKKEIKKAILYFETKQFNIYFFPKYTVTILSEGKDDLNLLDSLVQEYHELSEK